MPTLLLPDPVVALEEEIPSDYGGGGNGGGRFDEPDDRPEENAEPARERWATPFSAYRVAVTVGIVWIATLFAALTVVLGTLRAHSASWASIPLPRAVYLSTAILVISSLTIEFARFSVRREAFQRCARWLGVTLLLGLAFIGVQMITWRELVSRGFHFSSGAGSFCFFLITGAHALHLLGGMVGLVLATLLVRRLEAKGKSTAVGVMALYWHFMGGLWLYVLALLVTTVQQ